MSALDPSERKRRSRTLARLESAVRPPRPDADPSWREQAACRDHDRDLWFSSPDTEHRADRPKNEGEKEAIAICHACPVVSPCLAYALAAKEKDGIFGGFTGAEGDAVRLRRRRTASARGRAGDVGAWGAQRGKGDAVIVSDAVLMAVLVLALLAVFALAWWLDG